MQFQNMSNYQPDEGFDDSLIPDGAYWVALKKYVVKSETEWEGINFQFQIIDGEYKTRMVFETMRFQSSDTQMVQMAYAKMKALVIACGQNGDQNMSFPLCDSLVGVVFGVKIINKKGKGANASKMYTNINKWMNQQQTLDAMAEAPAQPVAPAQSTQLAPPQPQAAPQQAAPTQAAPPVAPVQAAPPVQTAPPIAPAQAAPPVQTAPPPGPAAPQAAPNAPPSAPMAPPQGHAAPLQGDVLPPTADWEQQA